MNRRRASWRTSAWLALAGATLLPKSAEARHCTEVSDIVGYEKCTRFGGEWATDALPRFFMGAQVVHTLLAPGGRGVDVSPGKAWGSVDGSALGVRDLDATGAQLRVGAYFLGPLYLGVGYGLGFGSSSFRPFEDRGAVVTPAPGVASILLGTWDAFLGLRVPLGRLSVRLEAFAALEAMTVDARRGTQEAYLSVSRDVLESRALLDIWATPHTTFGLFGGVDVLDPKGGTLGVTFEFHLRSFDGAFALW
jgi:hypothetical protein